jgi:hypothetical protein
MCYLPVVLLGTVMGGLVAWFGIQPTVAASLSVFGIRNTNMIRNPVEMIGVALIISGWAELIAILCAAQIRKIVPCEMIQEV